MIGAHNEPGVYVLVRKDDHLLFVLRENTGRYDGQYSLPAGRGEDNESFTEAAVRETLEEVGLVIKPEHLRQVHLMLRFQTYEDTHTTVWVDVYFELDEWSGEPHNAEPHKHSKIAWLPISDLPYDDIIYYEAAALKHILRNEPYGEIGWEKRQNTAQK